MKRARLIISIIWRWFRRRSGFMQALLVVPVLSGVAMTLIVGNLGLALMGTAVPIYAWIVGPAIGLAGVVLAKAGQIVAKDRRRVK